jgi:hypothetical protein
MKISEYDEVAKNLDKYINDPKWKNIISESKNFVGVVESISPSPCSMLLYDKPIDEEVGLIRTKDGICCNIDGYNCDKYKYLKNDEALEQFRKENAGRSYEVNRMKGLGEMDVDEVESTLILPEERIIKQITVEDIKAANQLFEDLMGTAIGPRKEYIKEHSKEATYNAE